ncbi:MAG TPA: cupin domain-containing protein [Pirellulaceae bacterium]|nr:cupin domain-containing protein [Pirellulaceae bacterium]
MATHHAQPGEIMDVSPLGAALSQTTTQTLAKTATLELIRLVLPSGKVLPPHKVRGEMTVLCLEGKVAFQVGGVEHELTAGKLLYLAGSGEHAVRALEPSSLLVTILLTPKQPAP